MSQTMTQTAMYRSGPEAGAASSSQLGGTMSDSAAFGAASATAASAVAVQPAVPLARLDMTGARAERIAGFARDEIFEDEETGLIECREHAIVEFPAGRRREYVRGTDRFRGHSN